MSHVLKVPDDLLPHLRDAALFHLESLADAVPVSVINTPDADVHAATDELLAAITTAREIHRTPAAFYAASAVVHAALQCAERTEWQIGEAQDVETAEVLVERVKACRALIAGTPLGANLLEEMREEVRLELEAECGDLAVQHTTERLDAIREALDVYDAVTAAEDLDDVPMFAARYALQRLRESRWGRIQDGDSGWRSLEEPRELLEEIDELDARLRGLGEETDR